MKTPKNIKDILTYTTAIGNVLLFSKVKFYNDKGIEYSDVGFISFDSETTKNAFIEKFIAYEAYKTNKAAEELSTKVETIKHDFIEEVTTKLFTTFTDLAIKEQKHINMQISSLTTAISQMQTELTKELGIVASNTHNETQHITTKLNEAVSKLQSTITDIERKGKALGHLDSATESLVTSKNRLDSVITTVDELLQQATWAPETTTSEE